MRGLSFNLYESIAKEYDIESLRDAEIDSAASDLDIFFLIFALNTIGEFERANSLRIEFKDRLQSSGLSVLLNSLLWDCKSEDVLTPLATLLFNLPGLAKNDFVSAFCYNSLGFGLARRGDCQLAVQSFQYAARLFERNGYLPLAWFCCFNSYLHGCVYNPKRQDSIEIEAQILVQKLYQLPLPVRARAEGLLGIQFASSGQITGGLDLLVQAYSSSVGLNRHAAASAVLVEILLLSFLFPEQVADRFDQSELFTRLESQPTEEPRSVGLVNELKNLSSRLDWGHESLRQLILHWDQIEIPNIYKRQLWEILFEQAIRREQFSALETLVGEFKARPWMDSLEFVIVDLRFHEAVVKSRRGDFAGFYSLVHQIQNAPRGFLGRERMASLAAVDFLPSMSSQTVFEIESTYRAVEVNGSIVDLSRHPTVDHLIRILVQSSNPLSVEFVFEQIYKCKFVESLHLKRFESLLRRSRVLLGYKDWILRERGQIFLNPYLQIRSFERENCAQSLSLSMLSQAERRARIRELILKKPKTYGAQEMAKELNLPVRTVQQDLKFLCESGELKRVGNSRAIRYQTNVSSH